MTTPTPKSMPAKPVSPKVGTPATQSLDQLRKFGRVTAKGQVFVIVDGQEIALGQYTLSSQNANYEEEALHYFGRKFNEMLVQTNLLEQRVAARNFQAATSQDIKDLKARAQKYDSIGDYSSLNSRLDKLENEFEIGSAQQHEENQAQRKQALDERQQLVDQAAAVASKSTQDMHWKNDGKALQDAFDQFQQAQQNGLRLGRKIDDQLWGEIRQARQDFNRKRSEFFDALDARNAIAKARKEDIIAEAEALSQSTDWEETSKIYKQLLDQWKKSPRGNRKEDDLQWARFREAQDFFFNARQAVQDELDEQYKDNLIVKEELLTQAQKLLPITDPKAARTAFSNIVSQWQEAGRVPRENLKPLEADLNAVEQAITNSEQEHWKKTDPALTHRANSMITQLEDKIKNLEKQQSQAQKDGDNAKADEIDSTIQTQRSWLASLQNSN